MSHKALETYLTPLKKIFAQDGVSEISINSPEEAWVEKKGEMIHIKLPEYTFEHLKGLSRLVAQSTDQRLSEEEPLLSATLPNGFRIQIVFPPACESGKVVISIRKGSVLKFNLDSYAEMGAFDMTSTDEVNDPNEIKLQQYLANNDIKKFIESAIKWKKNIIISGGTSTGKTTFTNACLQAIPRDERLITVEDAREIVLDHQPNRVHLLASKGGQGLSLIHI